MCRSRLGGVEAYIFLAPFAHWDYCSPPPPIRRPAYMDEYEKIELDLGKVYETYMERFRNLTFLEQQLDEYNRLEQDKFEAPSSPQETESSLKRMQNRLREEELRLLRGDKEMRSAMGSSFGSDPATARPKRPNAAGRRSQSLHQESESESESVVKTADSEDEEASLGSAMSGDLIDDDDGGELDDDDDGPDDDDDEDDEDGQIIMDDDDPDGSLGDDDDLDRGDGGGSDNDNDF
ncbi:Clusterin-associated protein-1-domain-containing protein [Blyttiomyces helicus]|uniref:Clusterin-associated protein-1-domain-containing protein n=1 Tax=Blyttiomyces helicus TaxID=388810 RepID=A0A4P9WPX3_9FUNG|nr:Clusterin-associated protein-1-domain-containing protein [Blyttiomyces helicus]|eukprot:RKO94193.1 Clusterin-associated protein-1-domain-containing protein [Blyttiomyces helicus]